MVGNDKLVAHPTWLFHALKEVLHTRFKLLEDIQRHPFTGLGLPEPLKHQLSGCWARRIDDEHRLVYEVLTDKIKVLVCRYHYPA